ncbi:MAG: hypothetical protein ACO1SX_10780 [Actinomycetota bacterium]
MGRLLKGLGIGCLVLTLLICGGGFAAYQWVTRTINAPKPADPKLGAYTALRPVFLKRGGGSYSAGTAVAVRLKPGAAPIVLTAQHLFGPMGGLDAAVPPGKLDQKIAAVALVPFGGSKPVATAKGSLRKAGEFPDEELDDVSGDVAAFKLAPKARVNALELAPANPGIGEWIWLVGDVVDHEPQKQRLFPGRVIIAADKKTLVTFKDHFKLQACSGAPLINAKKQVVGLLIGGMEGGGIINPAGSIRKRLEESGVH